jgi:uncharacterized membrane protein YgcG
LKRAKYVLLNDKLRDEYDLLGLDLEEDEEGEDHQEQGDGGTSGDDSSDGGDGRGGQNSAGGGARSGAAGGETVISHMASATIASIMQLTIRTVFMGVVSTVITRSRYTLYPTILFLIYTSYRIFSMHYTFKPPMATKGDVASPLIIGIAMYLMYNGRNFNPLDADIVDATTTDVDTTIDTVPWSYQFWFGELTVLTLFILNSLTMNGTTSNRPSTAATVGIIILSSLVTLWLRGKFWRYGTIVFIELGFALVAVLAFPMMEMVLEEIMKEKMKKVGEKVRIYAKSLEEELAKSKACSDSMSGGGIHVSTTGGGPKKRYGGGSSGDID